MSKRILFLFLFLILQSCSTLSDALQAKGQGTTKIYNVSADKVWMQIKNAAVEIGLDIASENKEENYILAKRGFSFGSWGENVAIFVTKEKDPNKTKVEVVSKRTVAISIFAVNWEPRVIEKLDEKIR